MANPTTTRGRPFRLPRPARLFTLILPVVLLTACAVIPEPLTDHELTLQAEEDIDRLFTDTDSLSETGVLTLPWAIARALKYNLDHRVRMMEHALALDQLDADKFDLLPELVANAGYYGRSEYNASQSVDPTTGELMDADSYSYSSEKRWTTSDFTASWNVLDFGISYFSAKQSADRALIATERRRKVLHNLIQEVFFSYWRVAAYQQLQAAIRETIESAEKELANAESEIQEKLMDPLQALRYQKKLLENIQKLDSIEEEFSMAHIDLAALINVKPGTPIRVAFPEWGNLRIPEWDMPLDRMEELAFRNNPDIREGSYQSRIAVKETRKAILSLLPGITLTGSDQYHSSDLLEKNRWYEWSTELTWNVFDILRAPARIGYAETNEKATELQRLALRMAVLAQVHVANHEFEDARKRFRRADRFFRVNRRIVDLVAAGRIGKQSIRTSIYEKTNEILSELQRYQTYAKLQAAYGRLHSTIGLDIAPSSVISSDLEAVAAVVRDRLSAWARGELIRETGVVHRLAEGSPAAAFVRDIEPCDKTCASARKNSPSPATKRNIRRPLRGLERLLGARVTADGYGGQGKSRALPLPDPPFPVGSGPGMVPLKDGIVGKSAHGKKLHPPEERESLKIVSLSDHFPIQPEEMLLVKPR